MKTELVKGPTPEMLARINAERARKVRASVHAAIKAGRGANPAEPRMVEMFLDLCHTGGSK